MARAKNTDRAEARRRHRDQQRVADGAVITSDAEMVADVPDAVPSAGPSMRASMRMPNIREDLRILPGMLLHTRKLWIPFIVLGVAFVLGMLMPIGDYVFVAPGIWGMVAGESVIPVGLQRFVLLFVQLTLPPTALFIFFIGGFLAPRASYLVGALLGLVDGILWSIYVMYANSSIEEGFKAGSVSDVFSIILIAVLIGTLAAGFAAWYRAFLRQSQERARANRMAREQAARAKAKEDERVAKETQRREAAAQREAARSARPGTASSSTTGKPPAKGSPPSS